MTDLRPFLAAYARVGGPDGRTLDEQVRLTRSYIRWELASGRWAGATVCYYLDPLPGDDDRMCCGLERLVDDTQAGRIQAVVCDRLTRFHESPVHAANIIALLESEEVHLVFLDEGVDAARLPREALASLAQSILYAVPTAEMAAKFTSSNCLRIASYARVNYGGAGAHAAIDSQVRRAEAFIAAQQRSSGWTIRSHVCYQDIDASGADHERPGLRELQTDVAAGRIDAVLCTRLDRLARTVSDMLELLRLFQTHGVRFIAPQDDIGLWTDPRSRRPSPRGF